MSVDIDLKLTPYDMVQKILRVMKIAEKGNPYSLPAMSSPPAITCTATSDSSLAAALPFVTSGVLQPVVNRIGWYGGVPTPNSGKYLAMPVASTLPAASSGNLAGLASGSITADMNSWDWDMDYWTDAATAELGLYTLSSHNVFTLIDGVYADKTGTAGFQAGLADNYLKVVNPSRKARRIQHKFGTRVGGGGPLVFQMRLSPGAQIWKPDQSGVVRIAAHGDSFTEGQGENAFSIANAPMMRVFGELGGILDMRQVAVGGCGFVNTGSGRSKAADQIPRWLTQQGPWHAIMSLQSYNDYAFSTSLIIPEIISCYTQYRAAFSGPIVFAGTLAGKRGPDATTLLIEAAIQSTINGFNDPYCKFLPVSSDAAPHIYGTGYKTAPNGTGNSDFYTSNDQIHLGLEGHDYEGLRLLNGFKACLYQMV